MISREPVAEEEILKSAIVEQHRKLQTARANRDELGADLIESDMNHTLERLAEITRAVPAE